MPAQQKVKFHEDVTYDGGGVPHDARVFKRGQTYLMDRDSADHWVRRRRAEYVELNPEGAAPTPPQPEAIGVPVGGKLDKASRDLQKAQAENLAPQHAAPTGESAPAPPLSAAEERAARPATAAEAANASGRIVEAANAGGSPADEIDPATGERTAKAVDPLASKNVGKAVTAPPRDKAVKTADTRKK